ncbi:cupin domain-containing protein [Elizabethkingia anophelis]|nr:cupin domain-containing protein [Elizabethkingia anophelis]
MKKTIFLLFITCFSIIFSQQIKDNKRKKIVVDTLLKTEKSWDGIFYKQYPKGVPELSVLKIRIPPNTFLSWHIHLIPNAGYVESGEIIVEKQSDKQKRTIMKGEALAEIVDTYHRGYTGKKGAVLIVFYAGEKGVPLSISKKISDFY